MICTSIISLLEVEEIEDNEEKILLFSSKKVVCLEQFNN